MVASALLIIGYVAIVTILVVVLVVWIMSINSDTKKMNKECEDILNKKENKK